MLCWFFLFLFLFFLTAAGVGAVTKWSGDAAVGIGTGADFMLDIGFCQSYIRARAQQYYCVAQMMFCLRRGMRELGRAVGE